MSSMASRRVADRSRSRDNVSGEVSSSRNDGVTPCMTEDFNINVRPFIDLIDTLRQFGLEKDVSLPAIAVVGDQSSGKSSVLEALSGVQLPRGSGIVTRCPLELRMKTRREQNDDQENFGWKGRIRYNPSSDLDDESGVDEFFDDPEEVESRVTQAQNLLAGHDKGISSSRITLDIESPDVPDLTLIDLPGITRVAVRGQRNDVSEQIRGMINDFIKQDQTIILAVVPANVDIATTEALQMAKRVDKEGKRTLGVVTKPDLIDPGSELELISVVTNERYRLVRGFTVVKCRGQNQIRLRISLRDAMLEEERFFNSEEKQHFRELAPALMGMKNLSKKLSRVLVEHIKENLPALRAEITEKMEKVNRELAKLGEGVPEEASGKMILLTKILQSFTESMGRVAVGDTKFGNENLIHLNPYKSAREAFEKFADDIDKEIPRKNDRKFLEKIEDRIKKQRGRELPRFINYQACEDLIKDIVVKFKPAAIECLRTVNKVVETIFGTVAHHSAHQCYDLERAIKEKIYEIQEKSKDTCEQKIIEVFKMEALVYSQDRNFMATYDAVMEVKHEEEAAAANNRQKTVPTTPHTVRANVLYSQHYDPGVFLQYEVQAMFEMICSYMNVCGKRITDTIPMTILMIMVKDLSEKIRNDVWSLLAEQDPSRLLSEDPEIAIRRDTLQRKAKRLQQASDELRRFCRLEQI